MARTSMQREEIEQALGSLARWSLAKDGRAYRLLEELNIGSSITYLTKIRNTGSRSGHE